MKLSGMAGALRKHGLTVVETPGWRNRGFAGRDLAEVRGVLWHHTVASEWGVNNQDAPSLNVCINGRPGLPGPLCQIVFGRSGTVYLTAAGLANHAGYGYVPGIPENMGNYYLIGVEMESTGVRPWDWTEHQLRVAPYLGAALETEYLSHLPAARRLQIAHKEYAPGKIDPAGWPGDIAGLRSQINDVLNGRNVKPAESSVKPIKEKEWYEMPLDKQAANEIENIVRRVTERDVEVPNNQGSAESRKKNPSWERENALTNIWAAANAAAADAGAARAIAEKIAERSGLTKDEIKDAVTEALRESTVDVDIAVRGKQ